MPACAAALDWYGWLSAALGATGAAVLARPLFILLRQREAMETLVYALDTDLAPDDLKEKVRLARAQFARDLFLGRKVWKMGAYPGVVLILAAFVPLLLQLSCLAGTGK
jgi:hypothetical protein